MIAALPKPKPATPAKIDKISAAGDSSKVASSNLSLSSSAFFFSANTACNS